MKKITFWLLLILFSLKGHAQITNGNYTQEIDERIKNLNKGSITSNILLNRVFSFARIEEFNQESQRDTSFYSHFTQAWSELNRASYVPNFATLAQLKTQLKNKAYLKNQVPIGIINTEFHAFNFGTTPQNANVGFNSSTGLFTNLSGKNPFVKKQTTIIAPLTKGATGAGVSFNTDALFWLYKKGIRIKTLRLYTNGSSFTLINNYNLTQNNHSTSYATSGKKTLRFVITYANNTTKTTYANLHITVPAAAFAHAHGGGGGAAVSNLKTIDAADDLVFQGYEENQAYRGRNEYRIYYNDENEIVDKPLYIIDGYDPNDVRKIDELDYELYTSEDESIKELMKYGNNINLIDSLNHKGFDVIVVNHPVYDRGSKTIDGGSDYIERNAYTFISLIRHIKSIQQGNEEAVVIGPSMGGLISRYALAYMEKKHRETGLEKWSHNTRLWVSFDSPHQGANIPIGVQKGIQYFADKFSNEGAQAFLDTQLDKPATKQMLVNHYTNDSKLPKGAPNFRNRFQTALDALGMPQNLRKIALLNGSLMGALNGVSEAEYLKVKVSIPSLFIRVLTNHFYHATNSKTGTKNALTFKGSGYYLRFLFWKIWIIGERKTYSTPTAKGSYDIAPGGYFNAQGLLADNSNSDSYLSAFGIRFFHTLSIKSDVFDPTHSFIPTKSALAYTGSTVLDEVIGTKNRVCSGETPFDSYFAPQNNEEHIFLTQENVTWLTKEIEGEEQEPTVHYSQMRGKEIARKGQILTYEVDPIGGNTTYSWYFDLGRGRKGTNIGGWSIIYNQGNKVTVKVGNPGLAVVVCDITSSCSGSTQKYIYVDVRSGRGGDGEDGDGPCNNNDIQLTYNSIKSKNNSNTFLIKPFDPCDNDGDGDFIGDDLVLKIATKDKNLEYSFSVHTIYGEKLYSKIQREKEFVVKNLKKGLYIVRYQSSLGNIKSKTIVIN